MKEIKHIYGGKMRSDVLKKGLDYIDGRRRGMIHSLRTPWSRFNKAGVDGLEWGNMLTIAARPGSGKTMIASQILREAHHMNPGQEFNILEFQLEMGGNQYASRAFAAHTALDYNRVVSSHKQLDDFSFEMMQKHAHNTEEAEKHGTYWVVENTPLTHKELAASIRHYHHELGKKKMIVTIDHSWLIKKGPDEKEKIATLYNTAEMLMALKNELPIIVIMLTQLNRNIDDATRKVPNTIGNYPTSNDVFGGDALMQSSDMLVALNRPHKFDVSSYGPKGYPMGEDDIAMHLLKIRNNADDVNMLFFRAEFDKQRMVEVSEPTPTFNPGAMVGTRRRFKNAGSEASGQTL